MTDSKPNFTLVPLSKEEGEVIVAKLQAFLAENSADLVAGPVINQNGTLGAEVKIFKKVELVPREPNVVSPIQRENLGESKTGEEAA